MMMSVPRMLRMIMSNPGPGRLGRLRKTSRALRVSGWPAAPEPFALRECLIMMNLTSSQVDSDRGIDRMLTSCRAGAVVLVPSNIIYYHGTASEFEPGSRQSVGVF
jgi:hypothetical protein